MVEGRREDGAQHRLGPPLAGPPPSGLGEELRIDLGNGAHAGFRNRSGAIGQPQIMFGVTIPF
ncbi:MAG: hypothetical protein ACK4MX_06850 [Thermaurantiacus sp.]